MGARRRQRIELQIKRVEKRFRHLLRGRNRMCHRRHPFPFTRSFRPGVRRSLCVCVMNTIFLRFTRFDVSLLFSSSNTLMMIECGDETTWRWCFVCAPALSSTPIDKWMFTICYLSSVFHLPTFRAVHFFSFLPSSASSIFCCWTNIRTDATTIYSFQLQIVSLSLCRSVFHFCCCVPSFPFVAHCLSPTMNEWMRVYIKTERQCSRDLQLTHRCLSN